MVTSERKIVDFEDIARNVEYEDYYEAPWDAWDGWEHSVDWNPEYDDARGYAWCTWKRKYCRITIDDSTVIDKWGFTQRHGEAKQVWLERVARVKRDKIDQLVEWYQNGWEWYVAVAEWNDYSDCVGAIYSEDYAEETALECALVVASQMERDGYIVTNKPEWQDDPHASFKQKLKDNMQTW